MACKIIPQKFKDKIIDQELRALKNLPYNINLVNYYKYEICSNKNYYFLLEYCNGGTLKQKI